jgi:hypothetical protein
MLSVNSKKAGPYGQSMGGPCSRLGNNKINVHEAAASNKGPLFLLTANNVKAVPGVG